MALGGMISKRRNKKGKDMPPTAITKYSVTFYGGANGFGEPDQMRAIIRLYNGPDLVGLVRFHDPGMNFSEDHQDPLGRVQMHMPSAMFLNVLDVLRNERPILLEWWANQSFLSTDNEPVGEAE
jgi:hypothetical protein